MIEQRQEHENVLLLDTGDALVGGGRVGDDTQGLAIVLGMGLMGYDAMALGPKELSLGSAILEQRMTQAEEQGMPMLSANVVRAGTDEAVAPAHKIIDVKGIKIAVIGLTRYPDPDEAVTDFQVLDPTPALQEAVSEVADEVDTVIVLTNLDQWTATALAMATPGIDLMIAARPDEVPDNYGLAPETGTIVVVADKVAYDKVHGAYMGRRVGTLQVELQSDGSLANPSWDTVAMSYKYDNDPLMTQLLDNFR